MAPSLRELFPEPRSADAAEIYSDLGLVDQAHRGRPYVLLNMISTVDGKASVGGKSGPIGNEADRVLFAALRTQVDAVMVGAGTIRAERYGRLVRDPALRARREQLGLKPDPLAVVVSSRLDIPADLPLFGDEHSKVVIFTNTRRELDGCEAEVSIEHVEGKTVPLPEAMWALRERYDVRSLLLEGGPGLAGGMLAEGLIDELFLSLAPKLAGGEQAPTIFSGLQPCGTCKLELVTVYEWQSCLFLRYRIGR